MDFLWEFVITHTWLNFCDFIVFARRGEDYYYNAYWSRTYLQENKRLGGNFLAGLMSAGFIMDGFDQLP